MRDRIAAACRSAQIALPLISIMKPDGWLGIELRHLAALQAVAKERSFGRAAEQLSYTQSAISQQIAQLERAVGQRLVERPGGPRPVSLTEAGELLLRHSEEIVGRLQAARADLAALAAGEIGTLRIGSYQSVGTRLLPPLLRRFAAEWPGVDIRLVERQSDEMLLRLVEQGELDLTFTAFESEDERFETEALLRDPYVLLVQARSPLADLHHPSAEEIGSLPLVGYGSASGCQARLEAGLRAYGVTPNVIFRSEDNAIIQGVVSAGLGAAIVPLLAVERSDDAVVVVELGDVVPPRTISVAWYRDRRRSEPTRAFVALARELCGELANAA